jgi:hypothetical protein
MERQTEGVQPPGTAEEITSQAPGASPAAGSDLPGKTAALRAPTADPRVDAALALLDELDVLPVTGHRAVFEDVHRRLSDVLGELNAGHPRQPGLGADPATRPGR